MEIYSFKYNLKYNSYELCYHRCLVGAVRWSIRSKATFQTPGQTTPLKTKNEKNTYSCIKVTHSNMWCEKLGCNFNAWFVMTNY